MSETKNISYHKAAAGFLKVYYDTHREDSIVFLYRFINHLAREAKLIARSVSLKEMDFQNAIVGTWFLYTGITDITEGIPPEKHELLRQYFEEAAYPHEERSVVEEAINLVLAEGSVQTKVQKVLMDAWYSQLALPNLLENTLLLKEEVERITCKEKPEISFVRVYLRLFIRARFHTPFALDKYQAMRERNFQLLEKRLHKLEETEKKAQRNHGKAQAVKLISNKEAEDIFKIAFRNYNHLVSVADSKAALLINVNSVIISIMLVFVVRGIDRNMALLPPTILLLVVSMVTILLCILASRPQKAGCISGLQLECSQRFFFGSFDLIDPMFRNMTWERYQHQVTELFNGHREIVFEEVYKESFNVRTVLARKFLFLSIAYWVFIIGLLVSVIAFVIVTRTQSVV